MAWLKNVIAKWRAKPHQSEKERARRRRQMANRTHGYQGARTGFYDDLTGGLR